MLSMIVSSFSALCIFFLNLNINQLAPIKYDTRLICVSNYSKYFSLGLNSQIADTFWIRFLQEIDAFNKLEIAEAHLCPDQTSSWHFHLINVAMDLDPKFYELALYSPLLISVTISDSKGASILFDKAVENFPDQWRILYRASYQAQIEEKNFKKAADLLYRAGQNGAPKWVLSLAGGLYNEHGNRDLAEKIYAELLGESKEPLLAARLKDKLDKRIKNYFESAAPSSLELEKKKQ